MRVGNARLGRQNVDSGWQMKKAEYEERLKEGLELYCPICQRDIMPSNIQDVRDGIHDGFIYVHDDIAHDDEDVEAINKGIH